MDIKEIHLDYLREIMNIGVGKAASLLNTLLNSHIEMHVPEIHIYSEEQILQQFSTISPDRISSVFLPFDGNISGLALLLFPPESAQHLIGLLLNDMQDDDDIDELRAGTLAEVGNIVLNSVMGTFSNMFSSAIHYSVPKYLESRPEKIFEEYEEKHKEYSFLLARTRFTIKSLNIEGDIVILMEVNPFKQLLKEIDGHYKSIK